MASQPDNSSDDQQNDEVIGHALKWSGLAMFVLLAVLAAGFGLRFLMQDDDSELVESVVELPKDREVEETRLPQIQFEDRTKQAGIDWNHVNGMEGEKLLPETMGGGVAILDFDQDGDNDLLFVGGKSWDWAKEPVANPRSLTLYENDGQGNFKDVTELAGLSKTMYGMAPCIGDFDNDGWPDLFVTAVGENYLFKNQDGRFVDVTNQFGLEGDKQDWSTGAAWFDYNKDGLLDLFVCNYVLWNRELDLSLGFSLTGVGRAFGQPTAFTGTNSRLYRNNGDSFVDVSEEMGIDVFNPTSKEKIPIGKGLAVATVDVDQDGWLDIVVANDTVQNFLFRNIQGEKFEEDAISYGIAFDRGGVATGAMGIDCCFLRNDQSLAVAIGNFANEPSSLYVLKDPTDLFFDEALATGIGPESRRYLTFGMLFGDLDLDSRFDVVCTNGHLEEEISKVQASQSYEQPPQFFWNAGSNAESELVALRETELGKAAVESMVGRAAACGDLDGDGDLDLIFVANGGSPRLLINRQELGNNWLRVKLVGNGDSSCRDAIGSQVIVKLKEATLRQSVVSTRSYLSQCESVLTFGLGKAAETQTVLVAWCDGTKELFTVKPNELNVLEQGAGTGE